VNRRSSGNRTDRAYGRTNLPEKISALAERFRLWRRSGDVGERIACWHLQAQGYEIIKRNYRCRGGEVDVVARKDERTVFVEVKERRDTTRGRALDALTMEKRRRVIRAARVFAAAYGLSNSALRFDVIAVEWERARVPRVRHEENAFDDRGL
jgi:putative endonuclease